MGTGFKSHLCPTVHNNNKVETSKAHFSNWSWHWGGVALTLSPLMISRRKWRIEPTCQWRIRWRTVGWRVWRHDCLCRFPRTWSTWQCLPPSEPWWITTQSSLLYLHFENLPLSMLQTLLNSKVMIFTAFLPAEAVDKWPLLLFLRAVCFCPQKQAMKAS